MSWIGRLLYSRNENPNQVEQSKTKTSNGFIQPIVRTLRSMFGFNDPLDDYKKAYKQDPKVYSAISRNASTVASQPWRLLDYSKGVEVFDESELGLNNVLYVLENPNPFMTRYQFRELHETYIQIFGAAVWQLYKDADGVLYRIDLLDMSKPFETRFDQYGNIIEHVGYNFLGQKVVLPDDQVIIDRKIDPYDPLQSFSPTKVIKNTAGLSHESRLFQKQFFENKAIPGAVVELDPKDLPDMKMIQQFLDTLADKYGHDGNRNGGFAAVPGNLKVLAANLADLDLGGVNDTVLSDIIAVYGTPKLSMLLSEGMNRSVAETIKRLYMELTIKPRLTQLDELLNTNLHKLYGTEEAAEKVYFQHAEVVKEDIVELVNVLSKATGNRPFMSVNEARKLLNLPLSEDPQHNQIPEDTKGVQLNLEADMSR